MKNSRGTRLVPGNNCKIRSFFLRGKKMSTNKFKHVYLDKN